MKKNGNETGKMRKLTKLIFICDMKSKLVKLFLKKLFQDH